MEDTDAVQRALEEELKVLLRDMKGSSMKQSSLIEEVVQRDNLRKALVRVESNKGAAGIDGMKVDELKPYLQREWKRIKQELLTGTYQPKPVRRVEIPKANGGRRKLGIPTVVDRFVQQSVTQVLSAEWDKTFSEYSYGFRGLQ